VDTVANISPLKENADIFNNIQIKNTINIQGISEGIIKSKGLAPKEVQTDKYIIPYNFHIVNQDFAIPCDGIIGLDFIKELNCQMDLKPTEDWVIIRPNNIEIHIYITITYTSGNNTILLPSRSQVVRKIKTMSDMSDTTLIPNHEIQPGIYVANTITSKQNTFVRLLNTTTTDQLISITNLKCEQISDYNVIRNTSRNRE